MDPVVLGRGSPAAATEPALGLYGDACSAGWRAGGGSWGPFMVRAVTVAGTKHRLAGEPGHDCFAWARRDGWLAVSVADGLGSVPGAAAAAAGASRAAVSAGVATAAGGGGLAAAAREAVGAADKAVGMMEGACTLVVAVMDGAGLCALARVGDSTAIVVTEGAGPTGGAGWSEVFEGPDPEQVGTETVALPLRGDAGRDFVEVAEQEIGPDDVLVLVTDGVANPWRDGPGTVAPALGRTILEVPSPIDLARMADFSRQGCHDDRTLVCVWCQRR